MKKGKIVKKSLKSIGKRWHDFDFKLEKNIYDYLCCVRTKRKIVRRLEKDNLKFESYYQRSQYIKNKYEKYDIARLLEFSRYLNQRMRLIKPIHEYWQIVTSVIITLVVTKFVEGAVSAKIDFSGLSVGGDAFNNFMLRNIRGDSFWGSCY